MESMFKCERCLKTDMLVHLEQDSDEESGGILYASRKLCKNFEC